MLRQPWLLVAVPASLAAVLCSHFHVVFQQCCVVRSWALLTCVYHRKPFVQTLYVYHKVSAAWHMNCVAAPPKCGWEAYWDRCYYCCYTLGLLCCLHHPVHVYLPWVLWASNLLGWAVLSWAYCNPTNARTQCCCADRLGCARWAGWLGFIVPLNACMYLLQVVQ